MNSDCIAACLFSEPFSKSVMVDNITFKSCDAEIDRFCFELYACIGLFLQHTFEEFKFLGQMMHHLVFTKAVCQFVQSHFYALETMFIKTFKYYLCVGTTFLKKDFIWGSNTVGRTLVLLAAILVFFALMP